VSGLAGIGRDSATKQTVPEHRLPECGRRERDN